MTTSKQILFGSLLILVLLTTAAAQEGEGPGSSVQKSSVTITAADDDEQAGIAAFHSVVTMRGEFYALKAAKYFDEKVRGSSVFDWRLRDGRSPRFRAGDTRTDFNATDSMTPLSSSNATPGSLPKWLGAVGTLTNSVIYESANHIGIGTTAPFELLTINSPAATSNDIGLLVNNTLHAVWGIAGKPDGLITGSSLGDSAFKSSKNILFSTNWGGSAQLYLKNDGNVGIGTGSPSFLLDIKGNGAGAGNGIQMENSGLTDGDDAQIVFKTKLSRVFSMGLDRSTGMFSFTPNNAKLGGAGSVVINALNGFVGIGTTDPKGLLDVQGDNTYAITGFSTSSTGVFGRSTSSYGVSGVSDGGFGVAGYSNTGAGIVARSESGNLVEGYNFLFRVFHIDGAGTYVTGSDFAEALPARGGKEGYEPGDVLVVSVKAPGTVEKTSQPDDERLAGVYSKRPGMLGADKNGTSRVDPDELPVAIVGIVPTKVSAENGPVQPGDLLTTSRTPGYAMKASPVLIQGLKVYRAGTILGKALEPLKQGKGLIKVLVTLR